MILINMKKPKRCVDCKLKRDKHLPTACIFRDWQSLTVNDTPQTNEWCPLVEVPEDVQPVVRCKDCLHSKLNEIDNESYICKLSGHLFAPNFYCASGRRKDGET